MRKTLIMLTLLLAVVISTIATQPPPTGYYTPRKSTSVITFTVANGYQEKNTTVALNYNVGNFLNDQPRVIDEIKYDNQYRTVYGINTKTISTVWNPVFINNVLQGFNVIRITSETGPNAHPPYVEYGIQADFPGIVLVVGHTNIFYPAIPGTYSSTVNYEVTLEFVKNDSNPMKTTFRGGLVDPETDDALNYVGDFYTLNHPTTGVSIDTFASFNVNGLYYISDWYRYSSNSNQIE